MIFRIVKRYPLQVLATLAWFWFIWPLIVAWMSEPIPDDSTKSDLIGILTED